jgi:UDP-N-acetylglucosamine 4,6-dehydratase
MLENKKILIFGGTGSLGYELVERYLSSNTIYNFSRDECKHWEMKLYFHNNNNLNFIIGDIINLEKVSNAISRVNPDIIIIAAAMKHIDQCELNQEQCINTNLLGIKNILNSVETLIVNSTINLQCVLFVSSDKACSPINVYGMCKALSEQLVIEKSYYIPNIKFVNIRYGNVLNSRGSIIPLLHNIGKDPRKIHFTITHPDMSRFVMTLSQSVDLIDYAINNGSSGDTIVPQLISMKVLDLIELFAEKYCKPIARIGIRPGEKMMETLINETQASRMKVINNYYHIKSVHNYTQNLRSNYITHECDSNGDSDSNSNLVQEYNSKMNPLSKKELESYLEYYNLL